MTDPHDLAGRLESQARMEESLSSTAFTVSPKREIAATIRQHAAEIERLREALEPFARVPEMGKTGGRFVIANATYSDMGPGQSAPRGAYWHWADFARARAALSTLRGVSSKAVEPELTPEEIAAGSARLKAFNAGLNPSPKDASSEAGEAATIHLRGASSIGLGEAETHGTAVDM